MIKWLWRIPWPFLYAKTLHYVLWWFIMKPRFEKRRKFGINASFESEFFFAVGILHGDVVFSYAVYLKSRIAQGRDYVFPVVDDSFFDE